MKKLVTAITTTTIAFTGASAMNVSADVHEVVKRDTLWDISQKQGTTVEQLMEWNHLTSSLIHPGQNISYKEDSVKKPKATVKPKEKRVKKQENSETHTVVAGDTLSEIAYEYGVTHEEIMEWNGLSTTLIFPDQELKVKKVEEKQKQTSSNSEVKENSESKQVKVESEEKVKSNKKTDSEKENVKEEKQETKPNSTSETKPKQDKKSSDKDEIKSSGDTYTVASGDTLSEIAFAHNVSFDKLMEWNDLSSTIIVPGQTLSVNGADGQASSSHSAEQKETDVKEEKPKQEEEKPESNKQEESKKEETTESTTESNKEEQPKQEEKAEKVEAEKEESTETSTGETMTVTATAYTAECEGCTGVTATGIDLNKDRNKKVIAVDPTVIPLGSTVKVEGYGTAIAGDVGGAIKGDIIDIHVPTTEEAMNWGRRTVNIEILD